MKKFNVKKFLALFADFYANESEIYDTIVDMSKDDLEKVKHECDKHFKKYYGVYDTVINMYYERFYV